MSEIEKMCENTRVYDFRYDCDVSFSDGDFGRVTNCSKGEIKDYCTDKKYFKGAKVINVRHLYPPFTAEKQLELIKWLAKTRPIYITFLIDKWVIEGMVRYGKRYDTFEDALSGYINNIWQTLTEQDRTEIAEILKE